MVNRRRLTAFFSHATVSYVIIKNLNNQNKIDETITKHHRRKPTALAVGIVSTR